MRRLSFHPTGITGCVEIVAQRADDLRGSFVKIFHEEVFGSAGLPVHFAEWYHTFSHKGVLRGLHVYSDGGATMSYGTTTVFAEDCDAGVAWDSAGVDWGTGDPILSERDRDLPRLEDYVSPFAYEAAP